MSKIRIITGEDTTYFCSECKSLAIDKVVVRNPLTKTDDVIWKCEKCGCTKIDSVDTFDEYMQICDNENVDYIKKKKRDFNF